MKFLVVTNSPTCVADVRAIMAYTYSIETEWRPMTKFSFQYSIGSRKHQNKDAAVQLLSSILFTTYSAIFGLNLKPFKNKLQSADNAFVISWVSTVYSNIFDVFQYNNAKTLVKCDKIKTIFFSIYIFTYI
jgi:hypothetical protein